MAIDLNKHFKRIDNIVTREIEGELVIVPIKSGLGDLDAEMYGLNETGIAVWNKLDGNLSLDEIIDIIARGYNAPKEAIHKDIVLLVENLFDKGLVIES